MPLIEVIPSSTRRRAEDEAVTTGDDVSNCISHGSIVDANDMILRSTSSADTDADVVGNKPTTIQHVLDACHAAARVANLSQLADALGNLENSLLSMDEATNGTEKAGPAKGDDRQEPSTYAIAVSLIRLGYSPANRRSGDAATTEEDDAMIQSRFDRCLDLCGPANAFLAAIDYLRGGSSAAIDYLRGGSSMCDGMKESKDASERKECLERLSFDPILVATATKTARRLLLTIPNEAEASPSRGANTLPLNNLCQDYYVTYLFPSDQGTCKIGSGIGMFDAMEDLASRSILLPVGIGSACHRAKLKLPTWAVRDRYCKRLVEVAVESALVGSKTTSKEEESVASLAVIYLGCLIDKMTCHGASDAVALGLHKYWNRRFSGANSDPVALSSFSGVVGGAISSISSSRDCATLLRSMVRFAASKLDSEQLRYMRKRVVEDGQVNASSTSTMDFLRHVCLPVLRSSKGARDAFFRLAVLSPTPSSTPGNESESDLRWLAVPCITTSLLFAISVDEENDDDDDDMKNTLFQYLRDVSETWCEPVFVRLTDESQQRYVTEFIMASIPLLNKRKMDASLRESIVMSLVQGVTTRLDSSILAIRRHGMIVAELLAPLLGKNLRFAELDGERDDVEEQNLHNKNSNKVQTDDSPVQGGLKEDNDDDDDSVWSEEDLVPYDLEDDEADLLAVKRPRYLRDCLALLRTSANDKNAFDSVQVALKCIAPLVKSKPPDLPDLAAPLSKELLHGENKFGMDDFASLRWDGLCALFLYEPIAVSRLLTEDLFESISLSVRLDILGLFEHAADELCGAATLREDRNVRRELLLRPDSQSSKVSGKRRLLGDESKEIVSANSSVGLVCNERSIKALEEKTRRWGRGRQRSEKKTMTNRFAQIAPIWLYPLIAGWLRTKHDKSIWGGSNGTRFFSSFLVALAKIVESSGNHPGTIVLASDLFELAWPFRNADSSEIRMAVLVVIATCCPYLSVEFLARNFYDEENLASFLRATTMRDSDASCRKIAAVVSKSLASSVMALGGP